MRPPDFRERIQNRTDLSNIDAAQRHARAVLSVVAKTIAPDELGDALPAFPVADHLLPNPPPPGVSMMRESLFLRVSEILWGSSFNEPSAVFRKLAPLFPGSPPSIP